METLRTRWRALLQPLGVPQSAIDECFAELAARYSEAGRFYHNLGHIAEVLEVIDELAGLAADVAAVRLAAWFHDVVYNSRAKDNEERSARLAEAWLNRLGLARLVGPVAGIILKTRTHENPEGDADAQILLDADLSILGAVAEGYDAYAEAIRREYAWVSDADYRTGRGRVLQRFLDRARIFGTKPLFAARERLARDNLRRELQRLNATP